MDALNISCKCWERERTQNKHVPSSSTFVSLAKNRRRRFRCWQHLSRKVTAWRIFTPVMTFRESRRKVSFVSAPTPLLESRYGMWLICLFVRWFTLYDRQMDKKPSYNVYHTHMNVLTNTDIHISPSLGWGHCIESSLPFPPKASRFCSISWPPSPFFPASRRC